MATSNVDVVRTLVSPEKCEEYITKQSPQYIPVLSTLSPDKEGITNVTLTGVPSPNVPSNMKSNREIKLIKSTYVVDQVKEYYQIDDEELFPNYKQHKMHNSESLLCWKNCCVGCGPVAWAMVFGYLNRRSHLKPELYGTGSHHLFKLTKSCNTCDGRRSFFPQSLNEEMVDYTEMLHDILGSVCVAGESVTLPHRMNRIDAFFQENQKSGNPKVTIHTNGWRSLIGNYSDDIRDQAIGYIKKNWPVVVGVRCGHDRLRMHYAVATRYREILKPKKPILTNFINKSPREMVTRREFFLHMGRAYHSDYAESNWCSAKIFFAGVATY
ncbi:uncharacterized protein LOC126829924 [Patella vulgata]|uniref:uncharacterized protein LOC126829924 n=1 Tax=Patella vulgata TaxID=6465 RepID=UPI00217FE7D8|nr:uncharacterized protein LOC126829924 [Patella vulgata]